VRIAHDARQLRHHREIPVEAHEAVVGVEQGLTGGNTPGSLRRINELGEDVQPGAGAAYRNAGCDPHVERCLDRSSFPEVDVVGLIAPGDPDGFGLHDEVTDSGILRCRQGGNDQRGHRVGADSPIGTQALDVGVVGLGACSPDDQEITSLAAAAHPPKRRVDICAPTHQDRAALHSDSRRIARIADPDIRIRRFRTTSLDQRPGRTHQQQESPAFQNLLQLTSEREAVRLPGLPATGSGQGGQARKKVQFSLLVPSPGVRAASPSLAGIVLPGLSKSACARADHPSGGTADRSIRDGTSNRQPCVAGSRRLERDLST